MPLLAPIRALVCCAALASLAGLGAGCSVIVDGELNNRGSDSGVGGQTCMFDAQCISFDPINCNRVCGPEGRCIDGPAPDGTRCGMGGPQHCVAQVCVMRVCGDGYVDRNASPPEYCDDGNMVDTDSCNNACTRSCSAPAPANCSDANPCNGEETCADVMGVMLCRAAAAPAENSACTTDTGETGTCRDKVCVP